MNIRAILRYVLLVTALIPIFVESVSCLPSDPCQYTSDILYGSTVETSFTGQIIPIENDPSSESLVQFQPLIRCFIPAQLEKFQSTSRDIFSIRTLSNPTPLSANEQHFICLFGCLRILYLISTFSNEPTEVEPFTFYVLIVSERLNTSCINTNESKPRTEPHSTKQYLFGNGHEPYYSSHSIRTIQNQGLAVSNSKQLLFITPEAPKLIRKCVPTEEYPETYVPSEEAIITGPSSEPSPESSTETIEPYDNGDTWMPSLQYTSTKSICSKVFNELVHRFDLVQENKTRILDYEETVKGLVPKDNRRSSNETIFHSKLSDVCYVTPSSTSVHVVSSTHINAICQFQCIKQYWKYEQTGEIVLFLFQSKCRQLAFKPCTEDLILNPTLGGFFFFLRHRIESLFQQCFMSQNPMTIDERLYERP